MGYKGDYIGGFFTLAEKLAIKNVIPMNEIAIKYRNML